MARISTYQPDGELNELDKVIGTDSNNNNATVNFSLGQLGEFYSRTGSAQSSVTFTFDVGTGYPNDELEEQHAYFNGTTFNTIDELRFSSLAHLGIDTAAFAAILPGTLISINQVGDNRGANYGFFMVSSVFPYSVNGIELGYRAIIEKIDGSVTYTGDIPSDYVSITPYGQSANITGSVGTLGFSKTTGLLTLESQEESIIGWTTDSNNVDTLVITENGLTRDLNIQTGISDLNSFDTDDLGEGTTNLYFTDARVAANSAVMDNTSKIGITTTQAQDIGLNNTARHEAISLTPTDNTGSGFTNPVVTNVTLSGQDLTVTYAEDTAGGSGGGAVDSVTAGVGLIGDSTTGDITLDLDFSELTNLGNLASDTQIIVHTASGSEGRITPSSINLSEFNNDSNWTGDQDVSFGVLSNQPGWPTTLSGYGITDGGGSGEDNQTIETTSPITGAPSATSANVTIGINQSLLAIGASQLNEVSSSGDVTKFLNEAGGFTVPGGIGSNGQSVDVWFADDATGTNASTTFTAGQEYVTFVEYTPPATPATPTSFTKFVGDDATGDNGQSVDIYYASDANGTGATKTKGSLEYIAFALFTPPATSNAPSGTGSYTKISGLKGDTGLSVDIFYADDADGTNANTTRQAGQEYIAFAEFTPPATATAPTGTGSYDKISADDGQSIQIYYASDANGTGASTSQGSNEFIAFVPFTPPASPSPPTAAGSFTRFTGGTVTLPNGSAGQVLGYAEDGTSGTPLSFSGTTGTSGTDYTVQFTSTGGPITAKVNVPATGSGTGRIPSPEPTREMRTQNVDGDPIVINLTITDANHSDITYVINNVAPTFVGGTGFTAPTPAGTGNTIAVTATDVSTTAMTISLTATDALTSTSFTQDHTITLEVNAYVPPPGDQYFYDEFSGINIPEYVSIGNASFTHGGQLTTGDSFQVVIPTDGEYAVVNIQNSVTTSPSFTADGGIGLTPDGVFAAADAAADPAIPGLQTEGFTSYWMAMNQGTHTITIRFS